MGANVDCNSINYRNQRVFDIFFAAAIDKYDRKKNGRIDPNEYQPLINDMCDIIIQIYGNGPTVDKIRYAWESLDIICIGYITRHEFSYRARYELEKILSQSIQGKNSDNNYPDNISLINNQLKDEIANLKSQINTKDKIIEEKNSFIEILKNQLKSAISSKGQDNLNFKEALNDNMNIKDQLDIEKNALQLDLNSKLKEINNLKNNNNQLEQQIKELKINLENEQNINKKENNNLNEEINKQQKIINQLKIELNSEKEKNSNLNERLNDYKDMKEQLDEEKHSLKLDLNSKLKEINNLKDNNYQLEQQIKELKINLESEPNKSQKENNNLNEEINKKQKLINQLKIELNSEKEIIQNLNERLIDYMNMKDQSDAEKNTLQSVLNLKLIEINNLKNNNDQLEQQIKQLKINLENMQNKNKKKVYNFDEFIVINFISTDQKISNCALKCLKTETFAEVEERLYQEYDEFRESNNIFTVRGNIILRFKIICENGIRDKDIIQLVAFDEKESFIKINETIPKIKNEEIIQKEIKKEEKGELKKENIISKEKKDEKKAPINEESKKNNNKININKISKNQQNVNQNDNGKENSSNKENNNNKKQESKNQSRKSLGLSILEKLKIFDNSIK